MKKRILEITDSDGRTVFVPQHKVLWWWWSYSDPYYGCDIEFTTLESARAWVNYNPRHAVLIHEA